VLSPPQRAQETHTTAVFPFLFCSDRQRDIPPTSSDCSPDPTAAAAAMSWDDHLNALKGHGLTHAAICDNKAASWITVSDGCNITQDELKKVVANMGNVTTLSTSGIVLGGIKYMYLSGDEDTCRGKKGTGGVHLTKSNTTLVVGIYGDSIQPQQAATAVEGIADHLKKSNY